MKINLFEYQKQAIDKLRSGSILCGGVGSGKSLTSLVYYFEKECKGRLNPISKMSAPKDLYIITTARKRDTLEWEKECANLSISKKQETNINNTKLVIDSWNNIHKYTSIKNAFFIFDEQRLIGYGAWVKSFLKISKNNNWILLSATPGDTWMDYAPVFIANGYYKNKTEFVRAHVIFDPFVNYPKINRYIDTWKLIEHRKNLLIFMEYKKKTIINDVYIEVGYDSKTYNFVSEKRWNVYTNKPIINVVELGYVWRKIVNSDKTRIDAVKELIRKNNKSIIFYNFNYELDILKNMLIENDIPFSEWNGHKHEAILNTNKWVYLVQYTSGAEGWNCIETDTIIFFSQNHSYRITHQAAGRIDRLNSPFINLYCYHLVSNSKIDLAISKALKNKKDFNILKFVKE